jgi:hypothetical protein
LAIAGPPLNPVAGKVYKKRGKPRDVGYRQTQQIEIQSDAPTVSLKVQE